MTLPLYHVAVMSFIEFDKPGEGVRHHFLKKGTDAIKELGAIFKLVWKN